MQDALCDGGPESILLSRPSILYLNYSAPEDFLRHTEQTRNCHGESLDVYEQRSCALRTGIFPVGPGRGPVRR